MRAFFFQFEAPSSMGEKKDVGPRHSPILQKRRLMIESLLSGLKEVGWGAGGGKEKTKKKTADNVYITHLANATKVCFRLPTALRLLPAPTRHAILGSSRQVRVESRSRRASCEKRAGFVFVKEML